MTAPAPYSPGPATGTRVEKADGPSWTLVVVRTIRHAPEKVWTALVDPAQLSQWAPFDADGSMATAGATVKLTTVGAPSPHVTETVITRAESPRLLEYNWGGNPMRWELEPVAGGTRLSLWSSIDRRFIAMGAAGWHICLDVLDASLTDAPIGRMVGMEVMKFGGWQRLLAEYSQEFGVEMPKWGQG